MDLVLAFLYVYKKPKYEQMGGTDHLVYFLLSIK